MKPDEDRLCKPWLQINLSIAEIEPGIALRCELYISSNIRVDLKMKYGQTNLVQYIHSIVFYLWSLTDCSYITILVLEYLSSFHLT